MAKKLGCKDMGMDCPFSVTSENEQEVMDMVVMHAGKTHADKMSAMSDEEKTGMMAKMKDMMQDVA